MICDGLSVHCALRCAQCAVEQKRGAGHSLNRKGNFMSSIIERYRTRWIDIWRLADGRKHGAVGATAGVRTEADAGARAVPGLALPLLLLPIRALLACSLQRLS